MDGAPIASAASSSRFHVATRDAIDERERVIATLESKVAELDRHAHEQQGVIDALTRERDSLLERLSSELALRFLDSADAKALSDEDCLEAMTLIRRIARVPDPDTLSEYLRVSEDMRTSLANWNKRWRESEDDPLADRRTLTREKADLVSNWRRSLDVILGQEDARRVSGED